MKQHRMYCAECKREWIEPSNLASSSRISISGNNRDDLCPICGSGQIELVEYNAPFPGGDIPRNEIHQEIISIKQSEELEIPQPAPGFIANNILAMQVTKDGDPVKDSIYDLSDMD